MKQENFKAFCNLQGQIEVVFESECSTHHFILKRNNAIALISQLKEAAEISIMAGCKERECYPDVQEMSLKKENKCV